MKFIYPNTREAGVVSILSVIFFIILMSIISVSFLRIITDEQEQVIQDDLSKGALAAARSGVEDAKRALLLCRTLTEPAKSDCKNALKNQVCPGIFSSSLIVGSLGLNKDADDGFIRVGDPASDNNERYTCVTLNQDTPDVTGVMSEGLGDVIPLRGTGTFNSIRLSWHSSEDGPAAIPTVTGGSENTRYDEWKNLAGTRYIAMPRIQLMQFSPSQPLNAQNDNTVATFLVPANSGPTNVVPASAVSIGRMAKRSSINCSSPPPQSGYECTAVVTFPYPVGVEYFLFVKAFYGTPHYKVELLDGSNVVNFADVQPQVDSTGAASNVFKRILSRVNYQDGASTFYTSNSIESGMSICKNFSVSMDAFSNECNTPASEGGSAGSVLP